MRPKDLQTEFMTLKEIVAKLAELREKILSPDCTPKDARAFFNLASAHDTIMQAKQVAGQQLARQSQPIRPANSKKFKMPKSEPLTYALGNCWEQP